MNNKEKKFSIFQGEKDGYPVYITVDTTCKDLKNKSDYPWFLNIIIPLINPMANGLANDNDMKELDKFENDLEKLLVKETPFLFIGRITYKGQRELMYYASNGKKAFEILGALIKKERIRNFKFTCREDRDWKEVKDYINL